MKNYLTIIFFGFSILFFVCCKTNKQSQDILKFVSTDSICKMQTTKIYLWHSEQVFCGESIFLNSDSTYLQEFGCEENENVSKGNWKIVGDSLELHSQRGYEINWICKIELSKKNSADSITTFRFVDRNGKPFEDFVLLPMKIGEHYNCYYNPKNVVNEYNEEVETDVTDKNGFVKINTTKYDSIEFSQLKILSGKPFHFSARNLPDSVKITLDVNARAYIFGYPVLKYYFTDKIFRYKKEDYKLIESNGDVFELEEKK